MIKKTRKYLYRIFHPSKVKLGIIKVYKTRNVAINKNWGQIESSYSINVLNLECYTLSLNDNNTTRLEKIINNKNNHSFKILLLNPLSVSYIKQRRENLNDENNTIEEHQNYIKTCIEKIHTYNNTKQTDIKCRLFSEELKWSLIIIDKFIFLSFYNEPRIKDTPCFLIRDDSVLGYSLTQYFNDIWNNRSKDALALCNKFCIIVLVGGSHMGKSIIARHLAEKYDFSGIICTDMIRNQLQINTNDTRIFSNHTPSMSDEDLQKQQQIISEELLKLINIYTERGEKIIIEGMHFTKEALFLLEENKNCIIIGIDNQLSLEKRLELKKITTRPNCKSESDYIDYEKARMKTIHSNLLQNVADENTIHFTDIEEAKRECSKKVEEFFLHL